MNDFPVMLKLKGRRCVVVGGGQVAVRRAKALLQAGAQVRVIAPQIDAALDELDVEVQQRDYRTGDLAEAMLVVIATDDPQVNQAVSDDAASARLLVNRADQPEAGDFTVPAHAHHGRVTISVHTGGVSASAAAVIRRQLSGALDEAWPRLIELAMPYRRLIQQGTTDRQARRGKLKKLTDQQAMDILKEKGPKALAAHYDRILG